MALKSKLPLKDTYANREGFLLENRMRLRVIWAWRIIPSQSLAGNLASKRHNPVIKWFLKVLMVLMALLSALRMRTRGGTNWHCTSVI